MTEAATTDGAAASLQAALPAQSPGTRLVLAGAGSGLAATVAMSAWMLLAQRIGFEHAEQPPKRIVEHVLDNAGVERSERADNALATVAHLGYGASLGVAYRWLRQRTRLPGPPTLHGAGWGLGVWAVNYLGWIPLSGVMPAPHRDHPSRQAAMVVAHLVFGTVLGALGDPVRGALGDPVRAEAARGDAAHMAADGPHP